jgi:hypothetical protein
MTAPSAQSSPGMTRAAWRTRWRESVHGRQVGEALAAGDTAEMLARACAAVRAEVKHRRRRNPRAADLIAARLAASLLAAANGIADLTPNGPRDITREALARVFEQAFAQALAAAQDQEGAR